jgi:hypothetical protein
MDNVVGPGDIANTQATAAQGDAAEQFAKMLDQATLSLGMQVFNQNQEALGEFQQEF